MRKDYGAKSAPESLLDKLSLKIRICVTHYYSLKER